MKRRRETAASLPPSEAGEPVWEVAGVLYPPQGSWTEEEYLRFELAFPGKVEFVDGSLDFHSMPRFRHERLIKQVRRLFEDALERPGLAEIFQAGLTCKIHRRHPLFGTRDRLPDIVATRLDPPSEDDYPLAEAILTCVEIVSDDDRSIARDHDTKRREYAAAGIPEYWIVDPTDPADPFVLVLTLPDGATEYVEHGTFRPGQSATSPSHPGLRCDVAELFAAAGIGG